MAELGYGIGSVSVLLDGVMVPSQHFDGKTSGGGAKERVVE